MDTMADNSSNSTAVIRAFLAYLLNITEPQRREAASLSKCQYVECKFSNQERDDFDYKCYVKPELRQGESLLGGNDYAKLTANTIRLYIYPIVIVMGILGNKLSGFIMLVNSRRNGYPSSAYLTSLAFVDGLYLIASPLPEWISLKFEKQDIRDTSDVTCRLGYFFGSFTTHLSAGLVVGITIERFIAVQYPLTAHKLNSALYKRTILCVMVIFFLLLNIPVSMIVEYIDEHTYYLYNCYGDNTVTHIRQISSRCTLTGKNYRSVWLYTDFAVYTFIPSIIIISLNSVIIRRLLEAQHFRQRMFRFSSSSSRSSQQDTKHRHHSDDTRVMGMTGQQGQSHSRATSTLETRQLVITSIPRSSN